MKIVWRTDVHMADQGPASRKDNWPQMVLDKLAQVRDIAISRGAVAILDGGDFFHIKSPSRNSHELINMVAAHHAPYPIPVFSTPGNHDSVYGDYAFLEQQPLGVLFNTGVFKRCYDEHEAVFITEASQGDKYEASMLGFDAPPQLKVRVVGVPYHGSTYDRERFKAIKKGDEDVLICVAHVLASPKGGTMFEGEDILKYSELLDYAPDVFCFGHWHKDQGVTQIGDKTIVNIGSLTRGSLSQDELQRQPACAVLSLEKGQPVEVEVVRLKVGAPEEVFDVEGRNRQVRQQVEIEAFVARIRDSLSPKVEGETLTQVVEGVVDVPADIKERALAYLELV